ncbi:ferrous iron transport protein B [Clostridium cochlearium]|uniref:Ferrous iron transport protein B n=1 Tax=Clostridium cochlearium TaxID=1494 RepID=A0A2X2W783_CLOCO|nr:ferrous iron transport protein B [Clostridium cochlearium]MBU5268697.1 ferrous iron transport protein B [Clostridium cochlearium]NMA58474.1 ferrous iron transport protein B [Clostridium cochlearium]SQB33493.1 ferrous iron transport protein B [Clostridium cochlearium]
MSTFALVGNPNSGKTTLFNALTGTNQHVGNWPGVTVEKKEGSFKYKDKRFTVIDLPGTYSFAAYSEDELIARNYILKDNPDVVINVVDATNIERNLYLTSQLMEMGVKVVVALNMMDEATSQNIKIDTNKLSKELGVPVIPIVAKRKKGISDLIKESMKFIDESSFNPILFSYGKELDDKKEKLVQILKNEKFKLPLPYNWISLKLLEGDEYVLDMIHENNPSQLLIEEIDLLKEKNDDYELAIVDKRYEFISDIVSKCITRPSTSQATLSDKIDKWVTNKWLGIPIFAAIMYLIFQLTFTIGQDMLGELAAGAIESLGESTTNFLVSLNSPEWLVSFVGEGIFGGIGAVVEFLPLIMVLYLLMGILEDTGYMARAAYVMDRLMRALGLHGKTFVSMIIGFGCNVPGIMAARTLESKKDRMIAILINPFMSCSARIPIYLVFIAAFFPNNGALVIFLLYVLGIITALIVGKVLSKTLFKGESSYFIMELPPYRLPTLKGVLLNMWDKVGAFLKRAGTIIFSVVTILWVLGVLPYGVEPNSEASILGQIGSFIAPLFKPAGFGNWQASVGLFTGIVAKEAVVATLGMVYAGVEEGTKLITAIQQTFTPLSAISFMVMTLFYTPCAAVIATIKKETNSTKWTLFSVAYTFVLGWAAAVLIYQIGSLLGFK